MASWRQTNLSSHHFLFADAEHEQHHQLPSGQSAEGRPKGGQRGQSYPHSVLEYSLHHSQSDPSYGGPAGSNSDWLVYLSTWFQAFRAVIVKVKVASSDVVWIILFYHSADP